MADGPGTTRIVLVDRRSAAPPPDPATVVVVLDPVWTARDGDRGDVVSVRPAVGAVIERVDVTELAMRRLDAWADAASLFDGLTVGGFSSWHRFREPMWRWLHERLLWRLVVAELDARLGGAGPRPVVVVPPGRAVLREAAADRLADDESTDPVSDQAEPQPAPEPGSPVDRRPAPARPWTAVVGRRVGRLVGRTQPDPRERLLEERIAGWRASGVRRVLVLSNVATHQAIGGGARLRDSNLGSVLDELTARGVEPIVVGLGLDHQADGDWPAIEGDPSLLPGSLLRTRWRGAGDPTSEVPAEVVRALDAAARVPLDLDGVDVGPAAARELRTLAAGPLVATLRQVPRIERLIDEIRPESILLTHEGIRTAWLVAARRRGIPSRAVQHGVIYPSHPGYQNPHRTGLILPSRTFVFGDYERRVLVGSGGYHPDEVAVSGSPRLDLDAPWSETAGSDRVRDDVRRELAVAPGDRLLVVSTTFVPFIRHTHFVHMVERVLGGPLPRVHVVFKQHPGELDEGPYVSLLEGLAQAGGYPAPPMTVVRDIDLYRLLRAADAHLGLRSTVLTDAVVAGTRNLIALVEPNADLLGYVAAGVAIPVRDHADLVAALDDPVPPDPAARATFLEDHFRPGSASARIATWIAEPAQPGGPDDVADRRAVAVDRGGR